MTDVPSIAAQIAYVSADIREPQEDWCAAECEFDAMQRAILATLQQHERLEAALRVVLSYAEAQPPNAFERINAVARAALDADETRKSPLR